MITSFKKFKKCSQTGKGGENPSFPFIYADLRIPPQNMGKMCKG